jgi:luciferase-like monooxygenase
MLREYWDLVQAVGVWPGAAIAQDRNGLRITLNGVKLGCLDWNGRLVLAFRREVRQALMAENMATVDPGLPDKNQIVLDVRTAADVNRAVALLRLAYLILDSSPIAPRVERISPRPGFDFTALARVHPRHRGKHSHPDGYQSRFPGLNSKQFMPNKTER